MARRGTEEQVTDEVALEVEEPQAPEATDEAKTDEAPAEAAQATPAKKKDELPAGWLTPSGLAHVVDLRPQIIYGYVKNGSKFPSKLHTDGRVIVPVPAEGEEGYDDPERDARAWIIDRRSKTEARKAEKAKADAAAAEADANAATDAQPEVGGEDVLAGIEES